MKGPKRPPDKKTKDIDISSLKLLLVCPKMGEVKDVGMAHSHSVTQGCVLFLLGA